MRKLVNGPQVLPCQPPRLAGASLPPGVGRCPSPAEVISRKPKERLSPSSVRDSRALGGADGQPAQVGKIGRPARSFRGAISPVLCFFYKCRRRRRWRPDLDASLAPIPKANCPLYPRTHLHPRCAFGGTVAPCRACSPSPMQMQAGSRCVAMIRFTFSRDQCMGYASGLAVHRP